ncbi:MAG: hypothetical protein ACLR8P_03215 [Clostridium fessum]
MAAGALTIAAPPLLAGSDDACGKPHCFLKLACPDSVAPTVDAHIPP